MNAFEKWQTVIGAATCVLLLIATFGAWLFGSKQTKILQKQTEINERLLELEYVISVDLDYDKDRKVFVLTNRSGRSIFYGGARFGGYGPLEPAPRQISVGGKQEIRRNQDYDDFVPAEGGIEEEMTLYLMNERREKYILKSEIYIRNRAGKLHSVDVRKNAPEKANW